MKILTGVAIVGMLAVTLAPVLYFLFSVILTRPDMIP